MSGLPAMSQGLWNLPPTERQKVYAELRQNLSLSETAPLLPIPPEAMRSWAQRVAELMTPRYRQAPQTQALSDPSTFVEIMMQYQLPANDAFCEAHMGPAQGLRAGGLGSLYINTVMNAVGLRCALQAAREVLSPEHRLVVETHFPTAMMLRHALLAEGAIEARPAKA